MNIFIVTAILTDGFEETEMTKPREALKKAGATVHLNTSKAEKVTAWLHGKWSSNIK